VGAEEGLSVDTGAEGSVDTSSDTSVEDATESSDESATTATPAQRAKLKHLGREVEYDPTELPKWFDDDHEIEFPRGPGGKPLKRTWRDIERDVQLSGGAQEQIRRAQQARAQLQQERELGKKNPYEYLQRHLGIEDPETWAYEQARKRFEQEQEIMTLMQQDPIAAQNKLRELERGKLTRAQEWEKQQRETQAQEQQAAQRRQQNEQAMAGELTKVGIKPSRHNMARAADIIVEHRRLEIELSHDQVAAQLRKEQRAELLASLDAEGENIIQLLGPARRAKLRELEIAAVKNAKKQQSATAPKPASQPTANGARATSRALSIDDKW
jgi:hypothetical protein